MPEEWPPIGLQGLIAALRAGALFPLDKLEEMFLGEYNAACRIYSALVLEDWTLRYGEASVRALLERLGKNEEWIPAVEAVFERNLDAVNAETRQGILERYAFIRADVSDRISADALLTGEVGTDQIRIKEARTLLAQKRHDEALRALDDLVRREAPPAEALLLAGRIALEKGNPSEARDRIRAGLQLEALRGQTTSTDKDLEALGLALLKLDLRDEAADAFRRAIAANPFDVRENGPYGRLLALLKSQEPVPSEYYELREKQLAVRRADAQGRLEVARFREEQGDRETALRYFKSAVGIQPEWIEAHREIARLAMELEEYSQARASLRALRRKNPRDARVLRDLARCARELGDAAEAEECEERLREIAPAPENSNSDE